MSRVFSSSKFGSYKRCPQGGMDKGITFQVSSALIIIDFKLLHDRAKNVQNCRLQKLSQNLGKAALLKVHNPLYSAQSGSFQQKLVVTFCWTCNVSAGLNQLQNK